MKSPYSDRADHMWWEVLTVGQYGELIAQWLEGRIPRYAGSVYALTEETRVIVGTLAAINRWGYITDWSQPGRKNTDPLPPPPPKPWVSPFSPWQRATVAGFADRPKCQLLVQAARAMSLHVIVHEPGSTLVGFRKAVSVSRQNINQMVDGETAAGYHLSRKELHRSLESRVVADALADMYQVTIIDTEWGRNDRLWPMLDRLSGRTT